MDLDEFLLPFPAVMLGVTLGMILEMMLGVGPESALSQAEELVLASIGLTEIGQIGCSINWGSAPTQD